MPDTARVLIVDDSRTFRAGVEAALCGEDGIVVAGSVFNGEKALSSIRQHPLDVVSLDVEMPGMDGLQVLSAIQQFNSTRPREAEVGVIMLSAFTKRGADITVRALQEGAFDFVTKPSCSSPEESVLQLRREMVPRIRAFMSRRRNRSIGTCQPLGQIALTTVPRATDFASTVHPRMIQAVLIGSSTGGPKALATILPRFASQTAAPIVIVQHMPAEFTRSLADNLARQAAIPVHEGDDGMPLIPGHAYIAPGGKHLVLRRDACGKLIAGTNQNPPESGCRPSASVLFRSAAAALGKSAAAIILTGMGDDGTAGLGALKRAGGYVIAQDEATSVVWGMPGSAVNAGFVDVIAPLVDIPARLAEVDPRFVAR